MPITGKGADMTTELDATAYADRIGTLDRYACLQDPEPDVRTMVTQAIRDTWPRRTLHQQTIEDLLDCGLNPRVLAEKLGVSERTGRSYRDAIRSQVLAQITDEALNQGEPAPMMRSYSDLMAAWMRGEAMGTPWGPGEGTRTTVAQRVMATRTRQGAITQADRKAAASEDTAAAASAEARDIAEKQLRELPKGRNRTRAERLKARELRYFLASTA